MTPRLLLSAGLALLAAAPLSARELGAHVHGTGTLDIALEGTGVAMELHAPGADIVGFEQAAETAEARATLAAAVTALEQPLTLFTLPEAAGCTVIGAEVTAEAEGGAPAAEQAHTDHDHDHDGTYQHMEFHARYVLDCTAPDRLDHIGFAYFTRFPGAQKLKVRIVSATGAAMAEVTRAAPELDLRSLH
ncbi:MAG: DUF2796 domain-containing protein [Pseudodonghicola sp.]